MKDQSHQQEEITGHISIGIMRMKMPNKEMDMDKNKISQVNPLVV